ncbi:hypothetical protein EDD85DRAFT_808913 [Armillaria nabsnona]|nr:hypothetical protein EDD85DRAFT_808913 [Armillaria nabsnona]
MSDKVCGYSLNGTAILHYGVERGWGTNADGQRDHGSRLFQKDLKLRTRVCGVKIQQNADINLFNLSRTSLPFNVSLQLILSAKLIGKRWHDVRSPFLQPHPSLLTDTQFTRTVQLTFYDGALFSTGAGRASTQSRAEDSSTDARKMLETLFGFFRKLQIGKFVLTLRSGSALRGARRASLTSKMPMTSRLQFGQLFLSLL